MRPSEVKGRAENYRWILNHTWSRLWPLLSHSKSEEGVVKAFEEAASPNEREFLLLASLILRVLRDPKFPKTRQAQINFLADSLAGLGQVSPRRSRDICAEQRRKEKRAHSIIRYEYWIECSCGYKGKSRDHACPKCGARIVFSSETGLEIEPLLFSRNVRT